MSNTETGGLEIDMKRPVFATHMTLLDYFAASASEEDIRFWSVNKGVGYGRNAMGDRVRITTGDYTREQARYRYAAAMLEARK